jgi:hypothetical protein
MPVVGRNNRKYITERRLSGSPHSDVYPRLSMSQYGKTIAQRGGEEFAAQTRARLETIKTHLETVPRSGKLKGKTCVITGAGSLKGIGSAQLPISCTSLIRL